MNKNLREEKKLSAITWRGLQIGSEYIAVALSGDIPPQLRVYHVRVVGQEDESGEKLYHLRCIAINGQLFADEDDAVRAFSLSELGCPFKQSPVGSPCRLFPYGELEYRMILQYAMENDEKVHGWFRIPNLTITYEVAPDSGASTFSLPRRRSLLGGSALSGWSLRR